MSNRNRTFSRDDQVIDRLSKNFVIIRDVISILILHFNVVPLLRHVTAIRLTHFVLMQNATASSAAPGHNVSSAMMDRPASASKVSWAILSPADNAFRMFARPKSRAPSQAYASAAVANDDAKGWFAVSVPCAIP